LDALRIIVAGRVYLVAVDMFVHSAGSPYSANVASGLKQRSQYYSLMPPCANPLRRRVVNTSDGNGQNLISIFVSIFFGGNGIGSENTGMET
jgi:hypothetical protein